MSNDSATSPAPSPLLLARRPMAEAQASDDDLQNAMQHGRVTDDGSVYLIAPEGEVVVEGAAPLRELNRRLGTRFPLDGPKTLNGLILEALRDLPEASMSVRFDEVVVEVLQVEDRLVRSARLRRLEPAAAALLRAAGETSQPG